MPILVNEFIAEVESSAAGETGDTPMQETIPLQKSEYDLLYDMEIIEERRQRLMVD